MSDLFRDTWVRYLGYANEVGEAFRGQVSTRTVHGSYVVASGYVLADSVDKASKNYKQTGSIIKAAIGGADCLLWQALASVIIPGFTINRLCAGTKYLLRKNAKSVTPIQVKWIATCVGLLAIPIIIHPIDTGVDVLLNNTTRLFYTPPPKF